MDEDPKVLEVEENTGGEEESLNRRGFLVGLRKWSLAVIGGALFGGTLLRSEEADAAGTWANRAGGGWANRTGGGGAWANRSGGGGVWVNRGVAWANHGAAWINRF